MENKLNLKKIFFLILIFVSCENTDDIFFDEKIFDENFEKLSEKSKKKYIDSLFAEVNNRNDDSIKVKTLFDLSNQYYYLNDYKSSFTTSKNANEIATKLKDSLSIGKSLYYMGDCFTELYVFKLNWTFAKRVFS